MESPFPPPRRAMALHSLHIVKKACLDALDPEQPDLALFRAVVEPGLVWQLATLAEQLHHDNEVLRKHLADQGWNLEPGVPPVEEASNSSEAPDELPDGVAGRAGDPSQSEQSRHAGLT